MSQSQQRVAVNTLREISNQQTNYDWTNKTRNRNFTNFAKKRKTAEQLNKPFKLPVIMKTRNIDDLSQNIQMIQNISEEQLYRSKSKPTKKTACSVRLFFKQPPTQPPQQKNWPKNVSEPQQNELQIIKSWLTRRKLQCKSLQALINKFKDDSGKYKSKNNIFPFKIKSLA